MLAVQAVKIPCLNVRDTEGIILHSDLGSQYTNQAFESYLSTKGMIHSFSRKGNPYDNAFIFILIRMPKRPARQSSSI